jgi:signal peptidase II
MARLGLRFVLIGVIAATVGCDRVTKHVASTTLAGTPDRSFFADTVRLVYVENAGGFLSLGADLPVSVRTALFTIGTGLMLVALVGLAYRQRWRGWSLIGLALFVAGGASNWIDRVLRGSVIDFMNVGLGGLRTGVFNVADVAIMIGVGVILAAEIRRETDADHADPPAVS